MQKNFLHQFGWKEAELTKDLVVMGHSFGGITALGGA
jgi:hypothetical protein